MSLPPGSDVFTVPFFQRSSDGRLVFIGKIRSSICEVSTVGLVSVIKYRKNYRISGSRYLPKFDVLTEGFTSLKMVRRPNSDSSPIPSFARTSENSYPWDKNQPDVASCVNEDFECGDNLFHFQHNRVLVISLAYLNAAISIYVFQSRKKNFCHCGTKVALAPQLLSR